MSFIETLKVLVLGIVEGFTEWLPISSTGHLILVDKIVQFKQPEEFVNMFKVIIQLGAILDIAAEKDDVADLIFFDHLHQLRCEGGSGKASDKALADTFKVCHV